MPREVLDRRKSLCLDRSLKRKLLYLTQQDKLDGIHTRIFLVYIARNKLHKTNVRSERKLMHKNRAHIDFIMHLPLH
jgi:hypothetical protein